MRIHANYSIKKYRNCICRVFKLACSIFFIVVLGRLAYEIIYDFYLPHPPLRVLPFWQDNRTYQTGRKPPSPITTVDKVNLSNYTLAIAACCRNVEKHLPGFQKNVNAIGALFRYYRIYLGESDSSDHTLSFIHEWMKNDSNHVRSYSAGGPRWRHWFRTVRIANCRNTLLQRIWAEMPSFDYYLVLDVDVASSHVLSGRNFLLNFIYPKSSWAAMTASQSGFYYDVAALRSWPTLSYDYVDEGKKYSYFNIPWRRIGSDLSTRHNKGIPRNHSLIEVQSAFGGAAIYAAEFMSEDCVYNGWRNDGWWWSRQLCEHVSFNECVRKNAGDGKFFINPQFENM